MADPVLTIPVVLDLGQANQGIENLRKSASEGVTFGAESRRGGPGSSVSPVERTARAYDRSGDYASLPQREGRAFVGGRMVGDEPLPFQREIERYNLNKYRREERLESRVERYSAGMEADAARDENRRTREQDRNETRFSRSSDAAAFSEFRQQNRNEARYSRNVDTAAFAAFRQTERSEAEATERARITAIEGTGSRARGWAMHYADVEAADQAARFNIGHYSGEVASGEMGNILRPSPSQPGVRRGGASPITAADPGELDGRNARAQAYLDNGGGGGGPNLYSRVFRGNTNFANSQLSYFQRFIAIEGIRTATALGEAYRGSQIATAQAQGDPAALAQVAMSERDAVASAAPLGIGKLAQLIRDPSGHGSRFMDSFMAGGRDYGELDVRQPLMDAQRAEATMTMNRQLSGNALTLQRGAAVAGSGMGINRQMMESNELARQQTDKATVDAIDTGLSRQREHLAALASIDTQFGAKDGQVATINYKAYTAAVSAENIGYDALKASDSTRTTSNLAAIEAANAFRKGDIRTVATIGGLSNVLSGNLALAQAGQLNSLSGEAAFSGRSQLAAQQQQENFANARTNQEEDNAYAMAAAKDPTMARFGRFAQMGARALRERNLSISQDVASRQLDRQIALSKLDIGGSTAQALNTLGRDPDAAIMDNYHTSMAKAGLADPALRGALEANAEAQRAAQQQGLGDQRAGVGSRLALAERTSGLLAKAYGPDAQKFRDAAAVTNIAGGAEISAQDILRQDSSANGLAQADSVRRTGINNLGAFRADLLAGYSSREGSLNRTALSIEGSSTPGQRLQTIDDATRALSDNIGSKNVSNGQGSAGSEAALLAQILAKLDNLVASD